LSWFSEHFLKHLIHQYGPWTIGVIVGLESMGLPLPGETVLLLGALYAGTHHDLNIWAVIGSAAAGAIIGDNVGYFIGRTFGYALLLRFGPYIGATEKRIKLGHYLFMRHGGKVVFFGRFVAVLRMLAAFLAGVNGMEWRRFLIANAAGGIVWSAAYGLAAYLFGNAVLHVRGPVGIGLLGTGIVVILIFLFYVRRHEAALEAEAEQALPGPLEHSHVLHRKRKT
jgi:membrane protein DedA with SNARE-associated domain